MNSGRKQDVKGEGTGIKMEGNASFSHEMMIKQQNA
jgi:hypothetical protein